MATKKKTVTNEYGNAPKTVEGHPFYGLKLDNEQKEFVNAILNPDKLIVFANARAGTGKTLMAVAAANLLVQHGEYDGIVYIVSPVQEEKLGFLPGSADEKCLFTLLHYMMHLRSLELIHLLLSSKKE